MHTGTTDALIENCTARETDFDTHGFDERRITFRGCVGGSLSLGNEAWFAGGRDLQAIDCRFDDQVSIGPNVIGATLRNCTIGARATSRSLDFYGSSSPEARRFGGGKPDQIVLDRCTVTAQETPILFDDADSFFGKARLVGCTVRGQGPLVRLESVAGDLEFDACRFETTGTTPSPISLANSFRVANLLLNGCEIVAPGASLAVWIHGVFPGSVRLTNNRLTALGSESPRFVRSEGRVRLVESGNTVNGTR